MTLLLCPVGIGLLIVLAKWIENLAAGYETGEDRLIIRRGIFVKSLDEVELYRVKDIRLDFSLVNQWAGIGTITLTSSDETTRDAPLVLPHIEKAEQRREELRGLVDAARQKRRSARSTSPTRITDAACNRSPIEHGPSRQYRPLDPALRSG